MVGVWHTDRVVWSPLTAIWCSLYSGLRMDCLMCCPFCSYKVLYFYVSRASKSKKGCAWSILSLFCQDVLQRMYFIWSYSCTICDVLVFRNMSKIYFFLQNSYLSIFVDHFPGWMKQRFDSRTGSPDQKIWKCWIPWKEY